MTDNQIILTSAEWKNLLAIDAFRKETAKLVRQTGAGNAFQFCFRQQPNMPKSPKNGIQIEVHKTRRGESIKVGTIISNGAYMDAKTMSSAFESIVVYSDKERKLIGFANVQRDFQASEIEFLFAPGPAGNEIVPASVFNKKWKLGDKGIPKEPTNKTKRSMAIIDSSGKIKSVPTDNPELN